MGQSVVSCLCKKRHLVGVVVAVSSFTCTPKMSQCHSLSFVVVSLLRVVVRLQLCHRVTPHLLLMLVFGLDILNFLRLLKRMNPTLSSFTLSSITSAINEIYDFVSQYFLIQDDALFPQLIYCKNLFLG